MKTKGSNGKFVGAAAIMFGLACGVSQGALVGWWTFDGTLNDSSPAGNHGTYEGAGSAVFSTSVPAAIGGGNSIDFAAGSEIIRVADSPSLQFDQAFTVSFWVEGSQAELDGYIMGKGNNWRDDGTWGFDVRTNGAGARHQFFSLNSDTDPAVVNMWGDPFDTGDQGWVHVVHVTEIRSGVVERDMYINGSFVSTFNNNQQASDLNGPNDLTFGGRNTGDGIQGHLDDIAIWDHALTAAQISALASGTNPAAIPEPGTLVLSSLGLVGLLFRRRKA